MSSTDRQNRLLLAEDWKRVYQSFKFADFKSYDFDNLRRTMIEYLRTNYPEDFNDYIESSEYLALIDMIAFLGQNISFRIDLNARENFLELAERKESVLRLARLLSYNSTRNQSANGLLKISSVSTTENIIDSNGNNLSGRTILWNDAINIDWFEQFIKVINGALPVQSPFGKPIKLQNVAGIPTEEYKFNSNQSGVPVYAFSKSVNNQNLDFEIVSCTIDDGSIIEEPPKIGNQLSFLYRDNGQGPGSNSSGFFLHFRQGVLQRGDFTVDLPVPNQRVDIDTENINQTDVWLYSLNAEGNETDLWNKVDAVEGNNIVYNSIAKNIRSIYSVLTRVDDRISLIFSDGVFGDLPKGIFRTYYRTAINRDYTILPASITNVVIQIPYISKIGRTESLTLVLDLKTAVDNASSSESIESIKNNAPATYYTQNRLITGEDYNIGPLGISQDIVKVKAVNRTSSGISRFYDILDATGKYSNTNLFATDGVIYKEYEDKKDNFSFITRTDIEGVIENKITDVLENKNLRNFFLEKYLTQKYTELNLQWNQKTSETNRSTGLINDANGVVYTVGSFTEGPLRFLEPGAMVKFLPPTGFYFLKDNELTTDANKLGAKSYLWTKVVSVTNGGNQVQSSGLGPIVFNDIIPNGSVLSEIQVKFVRDLIEDVKTEIIDQTFAYRTFGLRYDREDRQWKIITQENLDIVNEFNLALAGDVTNQRLDSSWLLLFETDGDTYEITYRTLRYLLESDSEIRFYFDSNKKIYDSKTGKIIKDKISFLNINNNIRANPSTLPYTTNLDWEIIKEFRDGDGYIDSKKIEIAFFDSDDDGVVDDIDLFYRLVLDTSYIFTKKTVINNREIYLYVDSVEENILIVNSVNQIITSVQNDPVYYVTSTDTFYKVNTATRKISETFDYFAYNGRDKLKFQYIHASDENNRIDPSSTNIIDVYLLIRQYDTNFRLWLDGTISSKPLPPSSDQLYRSYGEEINKIKSISDELIYHPVKFKVLFGSKSDPEMQAVFKIVKNTERVLNDNDLRSRVISAINSYFTLTNWEFGETFYWTELSAYIIKELAPDLLSIIIVPRASENYFGSFYEIRAEADEIFISSATVDDVEIISSITESQLRAQGNVVTQSSTTSIGIQSSNNNITSTTGGFIY